MTIKQILEYNFIDIGNLNLNALMLIKFVLIIMVGRLLVWLINKKILRRFYRRLGDTGRSFAISQFIKYIIYLTTIMMALQALGLSLSVVWGGAAALAVGFGLGLQQTFNDLVSGLILLIESSVAVGDIVTVDGMVGKVRKIGLRTSEVETFDDITYIIPNSKLVVDNVVNWSYNGRYSRFHIDIGTAYNSDPEQVKTILLAIAKSQKEVLERPGPSVHFDGFGASSLDFKLHIYTYKFWEIERIKSDIRFKIFSELNKAGIEIPFPQRDVWVRNKAVVGNGQQQEAGKNQDQKIKP